MIFESKTCHNNCICKRTFQVLVAVRVAY